MLELRSRCENCARELPADETGAVICSFECTFCIECARSLLSWVCPNCGGAQVPRPPRPRDKVDPTTIVKGPHKPVDIDAHSVLVERRLDAAGRPNHLWEVVVDCSDPAALARFYGELLGVKPTIRSDSWAYIDPFMRGPELRVGGEPLGGARIAIGSWDLQTAIKDAVAAGGTLVKDISQDDAGRYAVVLDPEGHELCFVDP